jgi:DNA-binding XRE family transcriptional regulator
MDLTIARAIKKKTQWDLRKATGIHQSKISLIERGYVSPSNEERIAIAEALGFKSNDILWPEQKFAQQ